MYNSVYYYKPTNYDVFDDFPKISVDFQNVVRRSYESFQTFSQLFRGLPKITEEDPKMF